VSGLEELERVEKIVIIFSGFTGFNLVTKEIFGNPFTVLVRLSGAAGVNEKGHKEGSCCDELEGTIGRR
jgi:hypothetical protein